MVRKTAATIFGFACLLISLSAQAGYGSARRHWTESGRIYTATSLNSVLLWSATYFSPKFRHAFEKQHVKIESLAPAEADRFIAAQEVQQGKANEFFIGIFTQQETQEFSTDMSTFWKAELTAGDGTVLKPTAIEMVPIGPYERKMFPYLNRWNKAYRVFFPNADLGEKFSLTLKSIEGSSTLRWNNR